MGGRGAGGGGKGGGGGGGNIEWKDSGIGVEGKKVVNMSPDEYIKRVQTKNRMTAKEFRERNARAKAQGYKGILPHPPIAPGNVAALAKKMKAPNAKFSRPWLEYDKGLLANQEGFHRALAAKSLGIKVIPVEIFHR